MKISKVKYDLYILIEGVYQNFLSCYLMRLKCVNDKNEYTSLRQTVLREKMGIYRECPIE